LEKDAIVNSIDNSGGRSNSRLILVDDNIRDVGGHYYELATLLLSGADQLGYQPILATHSCFDEPDAVNPNWQLHPTFNTRRLVRWSLGIDGGSRSQRDFSGKTIGARGLRRLRLRTADLLAPPAKQPQRMLRTWSDDLCKLLADVRPNSNDSLLVNTGDDFAMLALASAIKQARLAPMRIDVIFHFALYESDQADRSDRLQQLGRQIRSAFDALRPHEVHLHATTETLAAQLRETQCGIPINAIPYPTRPRTVVTGSTAPPLKAVLAGLPRAEKGRGAIADLLSLGEDTLLKNGRFRISMQMPARRWQSMIPKSFHRCYEDALGGDISGPLEVMTSNLSTEAYHGWLDTADLGLFLYEPNRYVARCSGVLLEMFARGIPVIVPDGCWLADQVRLAGGHGSIGYIYQDRRDIPNLMQQFAEQRGNIQSRSIAHASTIAKRHDGRNTLLEMGLKSVAAERQVA
jgi:hypothetical protein